METELIINFILLLFQLFIFFKLKKGLDNQNKLINALIQDINDLKGIDTLLYNTKQYGKSLESKS